LKKIVLALAFSLLLLALALSVFADGEACSDGTVHGACGPTKPKYCVNGNLTDDCEKCGCLSTKQCDAATNTCVAFSEGWVCKELTIRGLQKTDGTYQTLENCPAGCYEGVCNPDPCVNITCRDACFSNTTLNTKGFCEGGICIYKKQKCEQGCYALGNGTGICTENLTITETPELIINGTATLPAEKVGENQTGLNQATINQTATQITANETVGEGAGEGTQPAKQGFWQRVFGFFSFLKFWG